MSVNLTPFAQTQILYGDPKNLSAFRLIGEISNVVCARDSDYITCERMKASLIVFWV